MITKDNIEFKQYDHTDHVLLAARIKCNFGQEIAKQEIECDPKRLEAAKNFLRVQIFRKAYGELARKIFDLERIVYCAADPSLRPAAMEKFREIKFMLHEGRMMDL